MIKKLTVKYLESHEDSEIEFGKGLNLMIGKSNEGKSSLVRAASLVVSNRFDKAIVRVGHTFCLVKMETDKGWVQCERGENINRWECFDGVEKKSFTNIGRTVPEDVTKILGMGERDRGDVQELPNFMFQLEKHYMLSEVDGKKASSSMVARLMDNAIGLGGMEDLIKAISVDLGRDKKEFNIKTGEISDLKSKVLDIDIFNDYKERITNCQTMMKELTELTEMYNRAESLYFSHKRKKDELTSLNERMAGELNLEEMETEIIFLNKLVSSTEIYSSKVELLNSINSGMGIDVDNLEKEYLESRDELARMVRGQELMASLRSKNMVSIGLKTRVSNDEALFKKSESRFVEVKKELGVCPMCGNEFKEECCETLAG